MSTFLSQTPPSRRYRRYVPPMPLSGYTKPTSQPGLEGNVRVTSIQEFCQHLLPLPVEASSAIHAIHEEMKQQFWKDGWWANFSKEEDDEEKYAKDESLYHQSFVEFANAVGQACTRFGLVNDDCVQGVWVARPNNQSCEKSGADSFKAKPDIVHVAQKTTFEALDAELEKGLASDPEKDSEQKAKEVISLYYSNDTRLTDIARKGSYDKSVVVTNPYSNRDHP